MLEKTPLTVKVAETINQDREGWFWSAQITIEGESEETLSLRSLDYFGSRDDAADDLENSRPGFLGRISIALEEIGLFLASPMPNEMMH